MTFTTVATLSSYIHNQKGACFFTFLLLLMLIPCSSKAQDVDIVHYTIPYTAKEVDCHPIPNCLLAS